MLSVRPAEARNTQVLVQLRHALWPEGSEAEHRAEVERFFRGEFPRGPWAVLLAENKDRGILGFAEVSIRPYAEGCQSSRVAYLEGWYVLPDSRRQGIGRALVESAAEWGRAQGCVEFASDADPENEVSARAHFALGFIDVTLPRFGAHRV